MSSDNEQQESPPKENALVVVDRARQFFEKKQEQIAKWARNGVDPRAIVRFTLQDMALSWKLRDCTPQSMYVAILSCAVTGLEPGGLKQEAFIIPYWNSKLGRHEAKFQSGWRGIQKQALRTGRVKFITANTVYSNDIFELDEGTANTLVHKRARGTRGDVIGAYAWAQLEDGYRQIKYVPLEDLIKVQQFAEKRGASPAWREWPDEMRAKTALRRLGKYLPMGDDYFAGVQIEDAQNSDDDSISDAEIVNMFTDGEATRDAAPELAAAAAFSGAPQVAAGPKLDRGKPAAAKGNAQSAERPSERPTTGSNAQQTNSSGATGPTNSAPQQAASTSSSPAASPSSAPAAAAGASAASPTSASPAASVATPASSSPPASNTTPSQSTASAPAQSAANSASAPAAQSDNSFNPFGDDPVDTPTAQATMSVEAFEKWLASCERQSDILARKGEWVMWAKDHVAKGSPESIRMQDALAKRLAAVPE